MHQLRASALLVFEASGRHCRACHSFAPEISDRGVEEACLGADAWKLGVII